jgi:S1-C subfamily serine protease
MTDNDRPSAARPDDDTQPVGEGWPSDRKLADAQTPASQSPASQSPASQSPASQSPASQPASTPAPAEAADRPQAHVSYSPTPAPQSAWARPTGDASAGATPESWFEPAPAPVATTPAQTSPRAATPIGVIVLATLLSAILGSGGTYLALNASGVLNRPAATPAGQTTSTQESARFDESSAVVDAAAKVSPAVVQITSSGGIDPNNVTDIPSTGVGSGVIFDADGWILTNRHVVAGSDQLVVALKDGRTFNGRIYGIDTLTDLAIVKIDAKNLPTAPMGDSSALKVGQLAIAIGSPLGTYSNTVTSGIVSAIGRSIQVEGGNLNNLIQTDTAINPGNSGGPLLDGGGNVIGIDTAVATNAQGIGFAIPINIAKPLLQQALAGQQLARPWIGIRYEAITPAVVKERSLKVDHGAIVGVGQNDTSAAVVPNSPADKAGLKIGDIVTSLEGITIDTEHPLDAVLTQFAPGRTVTVEVYRNGSTIKLQVTLGTRPANL